MPMLKRADITPLARRASQGGLIALPVAALLFAIFALGNWYGLGRNLPAAEANVRAAFAAGVLQDQDWLPGNTGIGRHQYNDCLILYMAIDQQATPVQLLASPIKPMQRGDESMCHALRAYAGGDKAAGRTGVWYHQYIHGHTMLARYLLPHLSVDAIRNLYHGIQTLLVLAGLIVAMTTLARGRSQTAGLFWLIIFLAFSRWFGLESYGQSLSHAPSDAVIIAYLLFLAIAAARGGLGRWCSIGAAAVFGATVAIFEFLTGGIPLGLAIIAGGLPFALRDRDPRETLARVIEALAAFCVAVAMCLALKIGLALWVFGIESFRESAAQLGVRMGIGAGPADIGPLRMAKSLTKGLNSLAAGMHVMAGAMLLIAICAGIWGARQLIGSGDAVLKSRAFHLVASNVVIVGMLALLWQHTIIHAWFMDRVFVWTIATGFALFALAVRERTA
ncbi:hypothetical protein [Sphingomonas sp. Root710]|uniref:hypothetical protein n=1 Tax=Sphingomonas sp. Root710 TaxID=1736594 RepID=UPI000A7B65D6|nr:hypothetical protein [Sphingomonas sp. Root710]